MLYFYSRRELIKESVGAYLALEYLPMLYSMLIVIVMFFFSFAIFHGHLPKWRFGDSFNLFLLPADNPVGICSFFFLSSHFWYFTVAFLFLSFFSIAS